MALPFRPPLQPMLAKLSTDIPSGREWVYEPKWDGFRAIVFRDGDDVHIESRGSKPLQRYFPELLIALREALPRTCVVDGEIVLVADGTLEFDLLQQRIHPADSRVRLLAEEWPTTYVAFDLLATARADLRARPLSDRWARLEKALGDRPGDPRRLPPGPAVVLTPRTADAGTAARWLRDLEPVGLDGIIAKRLALPYRPGERVMVKVKRQKTADCVVGGYRMAKDGNGVGSLLLGLYDEGGAMHHVGFTSSFTARERRDVLARLRPHEGGDAFGHGAGPGGPSRWRHQEAEWVPLEPVLVCEVAFDHVTANRFRHGTTFLRWRDDKPPRECTMDQLRAGG